MMFLRLLTGPQWLRKFLKISLWMSGFSALSRFVNHKNLFKIMPLTTPPMEFPCFPSNSAGRGRHKPTGPHPLPFWPAWHASAVTGNDRCRLASSLLTTGFRSAADREIFRRPAVGTRPPAAAAPRPPRSRGQTAPPTAPLFVLRAVSVSGVSVIPPGQLASPISPISASRSRSAILRHRGPSAMFTALPAFISAAPSSRRRTSRRAGAYPRDRGQHHRGGPER